MNWIAFYFRPRNWRHRVGGYHRLPIHGLQGGIRVRDGRAVYALISTQGLSERRRDNRDGPPVLVQFEK